MRKYETLKKEDLQKIINECSSISEVLKKIGLKPSGSNHTSLSKYLEENNFDTKTLVGRSIYRGQKHLKSKTLFEWLTENGTEDSNKIKLKLFNSGIKQEKCEVCGITEWMGKKLTFELHHINGIHNDNRLENLIILCPNCHSQTENYCGLANEKKHNYCKDCGKEISIKATYCNKCLGKHHRKVERPSKEELLQLYKELKSLSAIGRKYNVSDKTISKWFISYNLPGKASELKQLL